MKENNVVCADGGVGVIPLILFEWQCLECGMRYWKETVPFDSETCCKCGGSMEWTHNELKGEIKISEELDLALSE